MQTSVFTRTKYKCFLNECHCKQRPPWLECTKVKQGNHLPKYCLMVTLLSFEVHMASTITLSSDESEVQSLEQLVEIWDDENRYYDCREKSDHESLNTEDDCKIAQIQDEIADAVQELLEIDKVQTELDRKMANYNADNASEVSSDGQTNDGSQSAENSHDESQSENSDGTITHNESEMSAYLDDRGAASGSSPAQSIVGETQFPTFKSPSLPPPRTKNSTSARGKPSPYTRKRTMIHNKRVLFDKFFREDTKKGGNVFQMGGSVIKRSKCNYCKGEMVTPNPEYSKCCFMRRCENCSVEFRKECLKTCNLCCQILNHGNTTMFSSVPNSFVRTCMSDNGGSHAQMLHDFLKSDYSCDFCLILNDFMNQGDNPMNVFG